MISFVFSFFMKKSNTPQQKKLFCVVFVSIKLQWHGIPKNNYRLNDTINFFVIVLCRFVSCRLSKKALPQTLRLNGRTLVELHYSLPVQFIQFDDGITISLRERKLVYVLIRWHVLFPEKIAETSGSLSLRIIYPYYQRI